MLRIENLNKHYKPKHALVDFSLTLDYGIYGLLGPNGAGKSTLMNILSTNLLPDKGSTVHWNDRSIFELGEDYRAILGFMPQQQGMYETFTARRFLAYMATLKGMTKAQAKAQIPQVLAEVELLDRIDHRIGSFSGGMKQRLLIAQAILGDPKLLILDEPTAGLDPKQRVMIRNLIARLAKNRIVLVSTHIVSDIESIADEVILMKAGKMIAKGDVKALCAVLPVEKQDLESLYLHYFDDDKAGEIDVVS